MEYLQRGNTLENVPTERYLIKLLITVAFSRLAKEGRLVLNPTKLKVLIDFISCQPQVITKALTRDNIMHGFFEAGYIDKVRFWFPDFNKILTTCRTDPTIFEYNLCRNYFNNLMELYVKCGHIEDSEFEKLQFCVNSDPVGNNSRRDASITQESRQRAKTLTHAHQFELRKAVKDAIELELQQKAKEKEDNIRDKVAMSKACEDKLRRLMGSNDLGHATHEIFAKLIVDELKVFILSRNKNVTKLSLQNKARVGNVIRGENNLIKITFNLRNSPNILESLLPSSHDNRIRENDSSIRDLSHHSLVISTRNIVGCAIPLLNNLH